jgi:hypothetical protein
MKYKDFTFEWLEGSFEERAAFIVDLEVDPFLDSFRCDPR